MNRSIRSRFDWRRPWVVYALTGVLTSVVVVAALRLWKADLRIPFLYTGDAVNIASNIKTSMETGWYQVQPLLNAPTGQTLFDYMTADNLHVVLSWLLRPILGSWPVEMNLYFLFGFLAAALAALWFFRLVGISVWWAVPLSVLFAIAPYHFYRDEAHMWLSAYYPLPLAVGLVYKLLAGRRIWTAPQLGERRSAIAWIKSPLVSTLAIVVLISSANGYYSLFIVLFVAAAGLARLVATRDGRGFISAIALGLSIVAGVLANMLPALIYSWTNGSNPLAVVRQPVESDIYALKFMQLILPTTDHQIALLGQLRQAYDHVFGNASERPALGIVAAVGFLCMLGFGLYRLLTSRPSEPRVSERNDAMGRLSGLTIYAFLISTVGGLAGVLALVTSNLRGWNRMSIVLGLFGLAAVGVMLDALRTSTWLRRQVQKLRRPLLTTIAISASVLLLLVGYFDQVGKSAQPDYTGVAAQFAGDRALVSRITGIVGAEGRILQLPHRGYPEDDTVRGVPDTDQLKPYLHSSTLRWSAGGVKGRPTSDWIGIARDTLTTANLMVGAVTAGFDGVLADTLSYGKAWPDSLADLRQVLGPPEFISPDGRYYFFTTQRVAEAVSRQWTAPQRAAIAEAVVHPIVATFTPDLTRGYNFLSLASSYTPVITFQNDREVAVSVTLRFSLTYTRGGGSRISLRLPDGNITTLQVSGEATAQNITLTVPVGKSVASFLPPAGSNWGRTGEWIDAIKITDLRVEDIALLAEFGQETLSPLVSTDGG